MKRKPNTHRPKTTNSKYSENGHSRKFASITEKKSSKYGTVAVLLENEMNEHEEELELEDQPVV